MKWCVRSITTYQWPIQSLASLLYVLLLILFERCCGKQSPPRMKIWRMSFPLKIWRDLLLFDHWSTVFHHTVLPKDPMYTFVNSARFLATERITTNFLHVRSGVCGVRWFRWFSHSMSCFRTVKQYRLEAQATISALVLRYICCFAAAIFVRFVRSVGSTS